MKKSANDYHKVFLNFSSFLALCLLLICSCATTAKYEKILNSWIGHDVNELISSWGPPSDEYKMPNGYIMYTWLYVADTMVTSNYYYYSNMIITRAKTYWCKTTFITDDKGKIINWRWEGNACRSY